MGEDVNMKSYVYSKVEKRYIDAYTLSSAPKYSTFRPFFDGRNYDLFSLFGSSRGNYKTLDRSHSGIPDFIDETFKKFLDSSSYYGYQWFYVDDLIVSIDEYVEKLRDPLKYFNEDDYEYDSIQSGSFDIDSWKDDTEYLCLTLNNIREKLISMRDAGNQY